MIGRFAILMAGCIVLCSHAFADSFATGAFAPNADPYARKGGCYKPSAHDTTPQDKNYVFWPANAGAGDHSTPLLLFLPGHGSKVDDYTQFLTEAAKRGYLVIGLAYRNGQSIQNMCGYWADCASYLLQQNVEKNTYNGFYSCGLPHDQAVLAAENNAINPRLAKFLRYLQNNHVANGFQWMQYYNYSTDRVNWSRIVVAGHSEGGATATWITKNQPVIAGMTFEAPYSDLDNAPITDTRAVTHDEGPPKDDKGLTPCHSRSACPYTAHGGGKDPNSFATYLHNDDSNWANKLWVTLSSHDKGYDLSGDWRGVNMRGATIALSKHEHTFSSTPAALNGNKWWTYTGPPKDGCSGHGSTVVNDCYPTWMPQYWDKVLAAAHP